MPDFHPYDSKVLFSSDADAEPGVGIPYNIYLADVATGNIQMLTDAPNGDKGYFQATWSPDGEKILMAGNYPSEIFLMPTSVGTPESITSEGIEHYYPRWIRYLGQ